MNIYEIIGFSILLAATVYLFWKGHAKSGMLGIGALIGYLVKQLIKPRTKELTPIQQLEAIKVKIDEAKKAGDDAVLATVPEPPDHTKSRKERWKNL